MATLIRFRLAALLALGVTAMGCGNGDITFYAICPKAGPEYCPPEDAGTDAGDAGTEDASPFTCEGQCIPFRPLGFSDPILVAFVASGKLPECPAEVPQKQFTMYSDLMANPAVCECACKPSTGACKLPGTVSAENAACGSPGATSTSFDPPADWDGSCTPTNSIPAGQLCDGVPCVQSINFGAMAPVDEACKVNGSPVPKAQVLAPSWGQTVIGCEGFPEGGEGGCGASAKCAPAPKPPPEFQVCVYKEGDVSCAGEFYTERHVIYEGFEDTRGCGPCGCASQVDGSLCTAAASIYLDDACANPLLEGYPVSSEKPVCFDLTPGGQSLGSKSIADVKYLPGTCQPTGGEPVGGVSPMRPATICCLSDGK